VIEIRIHGLTKEAAMTLNQTPISRRSSLARWWRERKIARDSAAALELCGADQVQHIARDLYLTPTELRALAGKRDDSAAQLYHRMADLGLDRAEVARAQWEVMRDLQKLCSLCTSKGRCERDFAHGADVAAWRAYCPNDDTLRALQAQFSSRPDRAS
jgi:hypothetical protein